jgi:hypothetical protein
MAKTGRSKHCPPCLSGPTPLEAQHAARDGALERVLDGDLEVAAHVEIESNIETNT